MPWAPHQTVSASRSLQNVVMFKWPKPGSDHYGPKSPKSLCPQAPRATKTANTPIPTYSPDLDRNLSHSLNQPVNPKTPFTIPKPLNLHMVFRKQPAGIENFFRRHGAWGHVRFSFSFFFFGVGFLAFFWESKGGGKEGFFLLELMDSGTWGLYVYSFGLGP